ncbi:GNAT family N-acetyltransferase [Pollutibacter soli]|uniref:GNAT family N-acetyltransferase n=1 Tax=Pollutibacter soli TaxID=3034157 RepID=UPI003013C3E3
MNLSLELAKEDLKPVFENLMQLYIYDFSEFIPTDLKADGKFAPYPALDSYWEQPGIRFPYLVKSADTIVGFVLVRQIISEEKNYFSIAEFFILRSHRRKGWGSIVAQLAFDLHKGNWEVYQWNTNLPAQLFWRTVITRYTGGDYYEFSRDGKLVQVFYNQ